MSKRGRGWIVWCGALILGVAGASSVHAQTAAVDRLLARAERAQGRRALALYERAAERAAPEDGRAALALADRLPDDPLALAAPAPAIRERAARTGASLDRFLDAAPNDPSAARAARLRDWASAVAGDHAGAIERMSGRVGLQDREGMELLRRLATVAVVRDDLPAARRALTAAYRAYPQSRDVLSELGAVELALGAPLAAVDHFQHILARTPDDLDTRRDLAGALVAAGRAEEAVTILVESVAAHRDAPELLLELAAAALEAGQTDRAEVTSREAIARLAADDARGHSAHGAALAAAGRRDDAMAAWREALERDPHDTRARRGIEALEAGDSPPTPDPAEPPTAARALGAP